MKRKVIILAALLIAIVSITVYSFCNIPAVTEAEAIQIAQKHVSSKYGKQFEDCRVNAALDDGVWYVSYSIISPDDVYTLGGGAPMLEISASNGRVMSCLLTK